MIENLIYQLIPLLAVIGLALSIIGLVFKYERVGIFFSMFGVLVLTINIAWLWHYLERPPLKTLGETRIWYSAFLPALGLILYKNIKERWIVVYSSGMGALFIVLNLLKPDNFDKTLMPALQSVWFVPHVVVYILAYALLGVGSLYAFIALYRFYIQGNDTFNQATITIRPFVSCGIALLTLGLVFGALWAKEAWGHYWTWDPKETWAFITWLGYLNYLHSEAKGAKRAKMSVIFLALNFIIVLTCWFGVNYLPTAPDSVHTYGS